jgi:PleD family two-component response regulator
VADNSILKLLLVEDDLEDENLIREALIEIEEQRQWGNWRTCDVLHVDQLSDALDCIRSERFDAVLLNLSLPDAPSALATLLQAQASVTGTPIIILADADDPALAQRLIREGAQDVVVKPEMECAPLARAIRYAIERERRWATLESQFFRDELTGASDRQGFLHLAPLYLRLAATNGFQAAVILLDLNATSDSPDDLDLLLIRATEVSRATFPEASLIGRLDQAKLAVLVVGIAESDARMLARRLHLDMSSAFPAATESRFAVAMVDGTPATIDELLKDCQRQMTLPAMLAD